MNNQLVGLPEVKKGGLKGGTSLLTLTGGVTPPPPELTQIKTSIRSAVTGRENVNIDRNDKSAFLWTFSAI